MFNCDLMNEPKTDLKDENNYKTFTLSAVFTSKNKLSTKID